MLRCFAAILVVMAHTAMISGAHMLHEPFQGRFAGGRHGVDLFFVLSGFIISYVHKRDIGEPTRLANYVFNRVTRIYPAVWIMSGFAFALYMAGYGGAAKAAKLAAYKVIASFILLPQPGDALVNVTWTLKYEVFFYAVFMILIINLRWGFALLLLWQLSALVLSSLFSIDQLGPAGFYFTSLSLEFSIGLACTWALVSGPCNAKCYNWLHSQLVLWTLCLVGAVTFMFGMLTKPGARETAMEAGNGVMAGHFWSINVPCALGSAILIISLVLLERAGRIKVPKILVFLGNASYSIYIVHFSIVTLVVGLIVRYRIPLNDIVCIAVAVIGVFVGSMFHIFVDQPLQKILRTKVKPIFVRSLVFNENAVQ